MYIYMYIIYIHTHTHPVSMPTYFSLSLSLSLSRLSLSRLSLSLSSPPLSHLQGAVRNETMAILPAAQTRLLPALVKDRVWLGRDKVEI